MSGYGTYIFHMVVVWSTLCQLDPIIIYTFQDETIELMREVMRRIQYCEDKIEEKDGEIKILKATNADLQKEMKTVKELNGLRQEKFQKEIDDLKQKNIKIQNEVKNSKTEIQSNIEEQVMKFQNEIGIHVRRKINGVKKNYSAALFNDLYGHVENLERLEFCYEFQKNKDLKIKWVLENYQYHFDKGKGVHSPVFSPDINGYKFQLMVNWSGEEKENLGLYLKLHRGESDKKELTPFKMTFKLEVVNKKKNGVNEVLKFYQSDIDKNRHDSFTLHANEGTVRRGFGTDKMLEMPRLLDYIHNDMLYISCTLYPY